MDAQRDGSHGGSKCTKKTLWQSSSSSSQAQPSPFCSTQVPGSLSPLAGGQGHKDTALPFHTPELSCGSEGLVLSDGEHKQKAFSAPEVIVSDGSVVLLASGVQNVDLDLFSIEDHLLSITVGFGGFIVFYKLGEAVRIKDYSRTLILHLNA